jgi:hypothetical protein
MLSALERRSTAKSNFTRPLYETAVGTRSLPPVRNAEAGLFCKDFGEGTSFAATKKGIFSSAREEHDHVAKFVHHQRRGATVCRAGLVRCKGTRRLRLPRRRLCLFLRPTGSGPHGRRAQHGHASIFVSAPSGCPGAHNGPGSPCAAKFPIVFVWSAVGRIQGQRQLCSLPRLWGAVAKGAETALLGSNCGGFVWTGPPRFLRHLLVASWPGGS